METKQAAAEEKKKQGNDEHKKQNYKRAVQLYSEAISKSHAIKTHMQ